MRRPLGWAIATTTGIAMVVVMAIGSLELLPAQVLLAGACIAGLHLAID